MEQSQNTVHTEDLVKKTSAPLEKVFDLPGFTYKAFPFKYLSPLIIIYHDFSYLLSLLVGFFISALTLTNIWELVKHNKKWRFPILVLMVCLSIPCIAFIFFFTTILFHNTGHELSREPDLYVLLTLWLSFYLSNGIQTLLRTRRELSGTH